MADDRLRSKVCEKCGKVHKGPEPLFLHCRQCLEAGRKDDLEVYKLDKLLVVSCKCGGLLFRLEMDSQELYQGQRDVLDSAVSYSLGVLNAGPIAETPEERAEQLRQAVVEAVEIGTVAPLRVMHTQKGRSTH